MKSHRALHRSTELAATLFERYGVELHRYLLRHLRTAQDANDLAQEVYLRLLRLERSELVRQPNAYLFFVASQVVAQFQMRNRSDPVTYDSRIVDEYVEHPDICAPDQTGETLDLRQRLERLLEKLPPTHRNVLLLRNRDGMGWAEIAAELGLSVHTVKKYVHEARARIRAMEWDT